MSYVVWLADDSCQETLLEDQKSPLRASFCLQFQWAKAEQHRGAVVLSAAFQAWELFKDHQLWWREMNGVAAGYHRWAGWLQLLA